MIEREQFRRIAIIGTGLIGGSFGLAVACACPSASFVAYDRPEVLRRLGSAKFRWQLAKDLAEAVRDADLVFVALPVGAIIEILPEIARRCRTDALVVDAGSTKVKICNAARKCFVEAGAGSRKFLGGHPLAGKELDGMENADPELFRGFKYVLIGNATEEEKDLRTACFANLIRAIGAEPVWSDAETHDWAMAVVSHMPQLVAIALAHIVSDETDETGLPLAFAGSGLRDMLRIAGSRYETWRDICMTNADNIARSLDRTAQAIEFLRTHIASRELEAEFYSANEIYRSLRGVR